MTGETISKQELELELLQSPYLTFYPSPRDFFLFNSNFDKSNVILGDQIDSESKSTEITKINENINRNHEKNVIPPTISNENVENVGDNSIQIQTLSQNLQNLHLNSEINADLEQRLIERLSELESYRKVNNQNLPEPPPYLFSLGDNKSAENAYENVLNKIQTYLNGNEDTELHSLKQFQILKIAVAALMIYVQHNYSGPKIPDLPQHPFVSHSNGEIQAHLDHFEERKKYFDSERWNKQRFSTHWEMKKSDEELKWFKFDDSILPVIQFNEESSERNEYAIKALSSDGELAYRLAFIPHYLLCSKILLFSKNENGSYLIDPAIWPSSNLWRVRVILLQQQLLNHSAGSLFDDAKRLFEEAEPFFSSFSDHNSKRHLAIRFYLEYGNMYHLYMRANIGRKHILKAKEISGLWTHMTGFFGKRTKFQTFKTSLLVLQARSRSQYNSEPISSLNKETNNQSQSQTDSQNEIQSELFSESQSESQSELHSEFQSETEVSIPRTIELDELNPMLEKIETENEKEPVLELIDQVILLSLCLNVKNRNPEYGLTIDEMIPFISRVELHPSNWMIHSMSLLLKSRLESQITKFAQRSLLQLEELVKQFSIDQDESPPESRLEYIFQLTFPSIYTLRKELGDRYFEIGGYKTAESIYEKLELWSDVIRCLYIQEKPKKATSIVEERLKISPNNPELWDLYGTVSNNPEHHYKAWEISNHSFALAMRNLGNYYMNKKDWNNAIASYQNSLNLNYLTQRVWFACGCAAIQIQDWKVALQCFSTAVQIEPDDAESWTNLSTIHMTLGYNERAIKALREALRLKPDTYQMWENHLILNVRIKDYQQVITSIEQMLRIRPKEVDIRAIRFLVSVIDQMRRDENHKELKALARRMDIMWEKLKGSVSQNPIVWELMAIYNEILGRYEEEIKCRLAQIRSLKIQGWETDENKFIPVCDAVEEAVELQTNIKKLKEHFSEALDWKIHYHGAITMLRNIVQNPSTKDFSNLEIFKKLETLLKKIEVSYADLFDDESQI